MGVNEVYNMQMHSSPALNFIENIFSLVGNPIIIISILALQYLFFKRKLLVFVNLLYVMGGLYFMALLKQIFQETRPFWINSQVKIYEWFCPTDFGNPSGHSFIVIALYEPLFSDFIGAGKKKFGLIIWTFVAALVMISRMYLGAHSLDQIVLGGLLGISFLAMYRLRLQ
jgi:membrane-associated phospholipid phosphatase